MTRRLRWVAAAVVAAVAASAGCGVPSETDIVDQGPVGVAGPPSNVQDVRTPPKQTDTTDPDKFIWNFLSAAAGTPEEAPTRVRGFLPREARPGWKPQQPVQVVRVGDFSKTLGATGEYVFQIPVQHVGELGDDGVMLPPKRRETRYEIKVGEVRRQAGEAAQSGLFVTGPPDVMLLSDRALREYYEQRKLYFWSRDGRTLVPDLRYLPLDVPVSERPTQIVKWLLNGPSAWLKRAVLGVDAQLVGNVPVGNLPDVGESLQVRLSDTAGGETPQELDALAKQLRWSLRGDKARALDLGVNQTRDVYSDVDYLRANPASRAVATPVQLCVFRGEVRQLGVAPEGTGPPAVPKQSNSAVRSAAMQRDQASSKIFAGFVRVGREGDELVVGAGSGQALPPLKPVHLEAEVLGRPAWVPYTGGVGLIVAGGRLLRFSATGTGLEAVVGAPAGITALAVPPDGRRIAYVHGGRLSVASLARDGSSLSIDFDGGQDVITDLTRITGVAWSQQTSVVVAGRAADGRTVIQDFTVDGALMDKRSDEFGTAVDVTHLVAFTDDPSDSERPGQVMFVAGDSAYNLFTAYQRLTETDINGSGTAPATQPDEKEPKVTAPFFLD